VDVLNSFRDNRGYSTGLHYPLWAAPNLHNYRQCDVFCLSRFWN